VVSNATVDRAVSNVLRKKFAMRLFDEEFGTLYTPAAATASINSAAHRGLALHAAREGTVLLRNQNGALPITTATGTGTAVPETTKVAVVGPFGGCEDSKNGTDCKAKIAMLGR
jgi:beta-glucosidase